MNGLAHSHSLLPPSLHRAEFSCGDHKQARPVKDHLKYMKEVLPRLDSAPYVMRYAWMAARQDERALVATDADGAVKLTKLGLAYNNIM